MDRALGERLRVNRLLDVYGRLLTTRQHRLLRLYYHDDLSLSEIAAHLDVTRQAVYDSLRRSVHELQRLEDSLQLVETYDARVRERKLLTRRLDALQRAVGRLNGRVRRRVLERILTELAAVRRAVR